MTWHERFQLTWTLFGLISCLFYCQNFSYWYWRTEAWRGCFSVLVYARSTTDVQCDDVAHWKATPLQGLKLKINPSMFILLSAPGWVVFRAKPGLICCRYRPRSLVFTYITDWSQCTKLGRFSSNTLKFKQLRMFNLSHSCSRDVFFHSFQVFLFHSYFFIASVSTQTLIYKSFYPNLKSWKLNFI